MTHQDTMLLLRAQAGHHRATKKHLRLPDGGWETESYSAGAIFSAHTRPVASLLDLARLLTKASKDSRALVIRGALTNGRTEARGIRRRYLPTGSDIEPCDHRWLAMDLDSAPSPDWIDPTDPDSLRRAVRWAVLTYLPSEFHGVSTFFRWSASAGVKPWSELRLQFWYWLSRPVCDAALRAWLRDIEYIDTALYNPVQPHYTATPVFLNSRDPLAEHRAGLIQGHPAVKLPDEVVDLETWENQQAAAEATRKRELDRLAGARKATSHEIDSFVSGAVNRAVTRILSAVEGNRHHTIFASSAWLGGLVGSGALDGSTAIAELEAAAFRVLPSNRHGEARRTVRQGLARGAHDPIDLRVVRSRHRSKRFSTRETQTGEYHQCN